MRRNTTGASKVWRKYKLISLDEWRFYMLTNMLKHSVRLICTMRPIACVVLVALMTTACGGSMSLDTKAVTELRSPLAKPPTELTQACDSPVDLKSKMADAVLLKMTHDVVALLDCKERKSAVQSFYDGRDAALAGSGR